MFVTKQMSNKIMPYVLLNTFLIFFSPAKPKTSFQKGIWLFKDLKHESNIFEIFLNLLALCNPVLCTNSDCYCRLKIKNVDKERHRYIHDNLGVQINPELYKRRKIKEIL